MADLTPYQRQLIRRYYANRDQLDRQRLEELVSDLYLARGKKLERLWQTTAILLQRLGLPQSRIDHVVSRRDPALVAGVVKELMG